LVTYADAKGELRKEYQITKDGFAFLVMGFTGKVAAKFKEAYILAFNKLEAFYMKRRYKWGRDIALNKDEHNTALKIKGQYIKPITPLQLNDPTVEDLLNMHEKHSK
jgi:phage regulator Rha-like protein